MDDRNLLMPFGQLIAEHIGSIRGTIIHDDQFQVHTLVAKHTADTSLELLPGVEYGDDDTEFHPFINCFNPLCTLRKALFLICLQRSLFSPMTDAISAKVILSHPIP